jgi:hypothetical protein
VSGPFPAGERNVFTLPSDQDRGGGGGRESNRLRVVLASVVECLSALVRVTISTIHSLWNSALFGPVSNFL